jgi:hypothetical protein
LVQFDQALRRPITVAFAGVLGGDAHQAHRLALQGGFDLLAQVGLRLVEAHAHFQPGLALGFGEQVDVGQVGQLFEDLPAAPGRGVAG